MGYRLRWPKKNLTHCPGWVDHYKMITRQCIEDIVDGAIKSGYQAVAGNEPQYGVTYPILIVLDPAILTPPIEV
mgnify:FL=1